MRVIAHIDPPRRVGGPPPDPSSPIATAAQVPSSPFRFATALVGIDHAAFKATIIVQNTDLFHPVSLWTSKTTPVF
jgi:hypothetical protein